MLCSDSPHLGRNLREAAIGEPQVDPEVHQAGMQIMLECDGEDKSLYNHMFSYNKIQPPLLCVQL